MIKLGKLAQAATEKNFPDNYKTIAMLMGLNFEMQSGDTEILIDIDQTTYIIVNKYGHIECNASLNSKTVINILTEAIQQNKNNPGGIK